MATPLRNVRVGDALWLAAGRRARRDGTTLTAIVVDALQRYVDAPEPEPHPHPCPCGCHLGPA